MKKLILIIMLIIPFKTMAVTLEEYNEAMASVALSAAQKYSDDFVYTYKWGGSVSNPVDKGGLLSSWLKDAYKGIKTQNGHIFGTMKSKAGVYGSFTNKFPVYCESFVRFISYHVSGGLATYYSDYETIKVSELKKGDLIHFDGHIAVYIDDGNDNNSSTWHVAEASSKVQERIISRSADKGYRIKESALQKLNYNTVTASYDLHDRLDDFPPVIVSVTQDGNFDTIHLEATDYKHYELALKNDDIEPENNGIDYYLVTKSTNEPTTGWIKVDRVTTLSQDIIIDDIGTWYVWVKDAGGNTASSQINITNLIRKSNIKPKIEISKSTDTFAKEIDLEIRITDSEGVKAFSVGKNDTPNYQDANSQKDFSYTYHITENGVYYVYAKNIYDNEEFITLDITTIDNNNPIINDLFYSDNFINVLASDAESSQEFLKYRINDNDWQENSQIYVNKNGIYKVSVKDQAGNITSSEIEVTGLSIFSFDNLNLSQTVLYISIAILVLLFIVIIYKFLQPKKKAIRRL